MNAHYHYALSWLGTPYIWGGQSRFGVDCSGLVQLLLEPMGLDPPGDQTAQTLFDHCEARNAKEITKFGSLAFFGKNKDRIIHVGFCLDAKLMIEARGGGIATTEPTPGASVEISQISRRSDLMKIYLPVKEKS